MKFTFADGLTIEGTFEQIRQASKALGRQLDLRVTRPAGYYFSESKQDFLLISDMPTSHIRRALLKTIEKATQDLRSRERILNDREFLLELQKVTSSNDLINDLYNGLRRKVR